ncbi:MAG: hypothetical protein AM325_009340 [Candidatus Thorarchaeota archaeon SMTZ1-45]|nr:MAG: hypothetical protein AM325_10840 [Candidatus Thorarchaeota archaeon SMTZ1-45]
MKRLSLIDSRGKDRLLLRNPAGYKGGFWLTYYVDEMFCMAASTENDSFSVVNEETGKGMLEVSLSHSPMLDGVPAIRTDIQVWSHNKPIMLIRHKTTNVAEQIIKNMKLYEFMDFDVGGPASYKDDKGVYDQNNGLMLVYDGNPLLVALVSLPQPDRWEIAPPTKLKISEEYPDLQNNLELGPMDVAIGLQWNLGNLNPGNSSIVDIVIASATSLEEIKALIPDGWKLFNKKIR